MNIKALKKKGKWREVNSGAIFESGAVYYKRDTRDDHLRNKQQLKEEKFAYSYYNSLKNRKREIVDRYGL